MATEQEATLAAEEELVDIPVTGDLSTGRILLAAREAAGLSEKEIADQLHITVHYVKALETDHYEKLPGAIFVKGYLKSYAAIVGEDPDRLVRLYNEHTSSQENEAKEQTRLQAQRRKDKNLPWVIVSVLVFVGGFLALWFYNTRLVTPSDAVDEQSEPLARSSSPSAAGLQTLSEQTNSSAVTVLDRVVAANPAVSPAEVAEEFGTLLVSEIQNLATQAEADIEDTAANEIAAAPDSDTVSAVEAENSAAEPADLSPENPNEVSEPQGESPSSVSAGLESTGLDNTNQQASAAVASIEESSPADDSTQEAALEEDAEPEAPAALNEAEAVVAAPEVGRTLTIGEDGADRLRFEFSGESWVEVADANSVILYRDIRIADDVLIIRGQAPFNVLVGNASRTVLTLNGTVVDVGARMRIDNTARITVGR